MHLEVNVSSPSRVHLLLGATTALLVACGGSEQTAVSAQTALGANCASLSGLNVANTTVTKTELVPAGDFVTPTGATVKHLPDFCRVAATIRPSPSSDIKVELWLPADWNGRFLGTGNGGPGGSVRYSDLGIGLRRGYAVANTDMGTGPDGVTNVIGNMERIVDYGHRSTHLMTTFSKGVIKQYYAKDASRSYFFGCSTGGAQGVAEALRYPDDYDGIVAGAMGHNRVGAHIRELSSFVATQRDTTTYFTTAKRTLWANKVMEACDELDGVKDGIIGRPDQCTIDPAVIQCTSGDSPDCLTAGQVDTMRKIYAGPVHAITGEQIYPGLLRGGEGGVPTTVPSPTTAFENFPFNWLYGRNWNWRAFDFGTDVDVMRNALNSAVGNTSGDLTAFKARNGKMILFQGLADGLAAPGETLNYLKAIETAMPGQSDQFVKLFNAPGMGHCAGGVGPNIFGNFRDGFPENPNDPSQDLLSAVEQWVEAGRVPEQIIATKYANNQPTGAVERTRPLCAWPKVSRYNGTGDSNSAGSFSCVNPE